MKKLMAGILAVMIMVCGVAACAEGRALTKEQAMQAALDYAKVSADQAKFIQVRQDRDDGRQVYEIKFVCNGVEYEMDVDVKTGRITDFDTDRPERYDRDDDWDDWFDYD